VRDRLVSLIVAIYIRVSTTDQEREGHSLEFQLADCERLIARNGWVKGPVYQDVESGYYSSREGYQRMLRDAEAGKFQILVIWRLDRLTRHTEDGLRDVYRLRGLGIKIVSATEFLDFDTARGRRAVREDISDAEYERDRIKERVMPGMLRGAAKGNYQGSRNVYCGFRYDKRDKRLVALPVEVEIVRIIFKLRAEGLAIYSIALRLAQRGIKNRAGSLFTTHQISIILRRTLYVDGIYVWNGVKSEQPIVEPIIDRETWDKVQAINEEHKREVTGVRPGRITSRYVLQGVLKCKWCKHNMVGNRSLVRPRTGEKGDWYTCGQRVQRTREACRGQSVKADTAMPLAFGILKRVMQNGQLIGLTMLHLQAALAHGHPQLSKRVNELKADIRRLKQEQEKCLRAHYADALTLEQFKAENLRFERERRAAEEELRIAEAKLSGAEAFEGKLGRLFELTEHFETVWAEMPPVQQRVIYRGVFEYLWIEGRPRGRHFTVGDYSLREPFRSWYNGEVWNGPLTIQQGDSVVVTSYKDNTLCGNYGFLPMDVK